MDDTSTQADGTQADGAHGDLISQLEMDMNDLGNLAAPQPMYLSAIEQGGVACPMEGVTVTFSREITDHVLRHHELFSSDGGLDLGNIRPLIPLNVDPPQHGKYRRILDPLFAPKRMDEQEADITAGRITSSMRSSIAASATSPRTSPSCSRRQCSSG